MRLYLLSTRLAARKKTQITFQKGAPQGYAQQAMFLSTYAVMAQARADPSQSADEGREALDTFCSLRTM